MAYGKLKLYGGPVTQHEGYAVTGKAPQDATTNAASASALNPTPNACPCGPHPITVTTMSNDDSNNDSNDQPSAGNAAAFPQGPVAFPNASALTAVSSWLPPRYQAIARGAQVINRERNQSVAALPPG
jgi:hypothetical protein